MEGVWQNIREAGLGMVKREGEPIKTGPHMGKGKRRSIALKENGSQTVKVGGQRHQKNWTRDGKTRSGERGTTVKKEGKGIQQRIGPERVPKSHMAVHA